jgi:hypothetical protein
MMASAASPIYEVWDHILRNVIEQRVYSGKTAGKRFARTFERHYNMTPAAEGLEPIEAWLQSLEGKPGPAGFIPVFVNADMHHKRIY